MRSSRLTLPLPLTLTLTLTQGLLVVFGGNDFGITKGLYEATPPPP